MAARRVRGKGICDSRMASHSIEGLLDDVDTCGDNVDVSRQHRTRPATRWHIPPHRIHQLTSAKTHRRPSLDEEQNLVWRRMVVVEKQEDAEMSGRGARAFIRWTFGQWRGRHKWQVAGGSRWTRRRRSGSWVWSLEVRVLFGCT